MKKRRLVGRARSPAKQPRCRNHRAINGQPAIARDLAAVLLNFSRWIQRRFAQETTPKPRRYPFELP
jgi:hypothetical protein